MVPNLCAPVAFGAMTPEEFRAAGHELVDWIADFRESLEDRPVRANVEPGDVRAAIDTEPPQTPQPFAAVVADLDRVITSGAMMIQHPMNFGWFPANASLASVLGDIASSGLGTIGISWESSPALTELEEVMCDWLRQLTGLSPAWQGVINDTASTATLTALLVARERATQLGQNRDGLQAQAAPLVIYTTEQAHSSVAKAALLAGFGWHNLTMVSTDDAYQMDPRALADAMQADIDAGRQPCAVVANTGSTGVTAMDPVAEIVQVAAAHQAWVHVDAAMAGAAMILPECRHLWEGVEGADSVAWNPHKWFGTVFDCSVFYVRDVDLLNRVMSTNPSYLQSAADGSVTQYRDWGIPLGRRFRALKLWFHLRLDGVEAIQARLRRDLENAKWLEAEVHATGGGWDVVAPVPLQTVCIRYSPPGLTDGEVDSHTRGWVEALNTSGATFLSTAKLDDRWMVRVSIGVEGTERRHVAEVWTLLRQAAEG